MIWNVLTWKYLRLEEEGAAGPARHHRLPLPEHLLLLRLGLGFGLSNLLGLGRGGGLLIAVWSSPGPAPG